MLIGELAWKGRAAALTVLVLTGIYAAGVYGGEPGDDLAQMEIHPDFEIQQVAREPVVRDPVDMRFDAQGRVYVLEMNGYPIAPSEEDQYPGKIVILEDTDEDGVYDQRKVFGDSFRYATAILPYRGGLLVASPPDLLMLRDTDGDGVADEREVLLSGFSVGNSQHNYNGLVYGLDNWIYAGNGGNSGTVHWPDRPGERMPVGWRDFRIDPEGQRLEFIGRTTTGYGIALDDWGHVFTTHNMRHIHHLVFFQRYVDRNRYVSGPTITEIADHTEKGTARIYAIGEQQPRVNHPEQSGYFSGACGITYYGGNAFPEEFNGNIFVGDVVLNLVHRDVLQPAGPSYVAQRGRERVEFFATRDRWFRPVNMTVGPDGALYLLDFHREVIEHPEWIPDELEAEMDLNAGKDQGRIYRITPRGGLARAEPDFDPERLAEAVRHLEDGNKWWRDTAQRMLVEWARPESVSLLEDLVTESERPRGRVHALWTLHGLGKLREEMLLQGLRDSHPGVKENALIMAEGRASASSDVREAMIELASDPNARVRLQAALSLGELYGKSPARDEGIRDAWLRVLERDATNRWSRLAILSGLDANPWSMFEAYTREHLGGDKTGSSITGDSIVFLKELAEVIGARQDGEELEEILDWLREAELPRASRSWEILEGLTTGIERSPHGRPGRGVRQRLTILLKRFPTDTADDKLRLWRLAQALGISPPGLESDTLEQAAAIVQGESASVDRRLVHLKLLEFSEFSFRRDLLFDLLHFRQPKEIQREAMRQLSQRRSEEVARRLIRMWPQLSPEIRMQAGNLLLYRPDNHDLLLTALEENKIPIGQMNFDLERRRRLLRSDRDRIRRRAKALFSDAGVVTRREALAQMQPALSVSGEPESGKELFQSLCASCHRLGGQGHEVGPNLTDIYRKSKPTLLHDILDPNAAVDVEYFGYLIETKEGEIYSGIIEEEDDEVVTLRAAGGQRQTIPRQDIARINSSGLSLMPEGLESGMSPQAMADLLAYLQQPR